LTLACCVAVVATLIAPLSARAATFTVTTTADSNDGSCTPALCSFRDALNAAEGQPPGSTVVVPAGTYKGTMLAGNGVWSPSGQYTIQGAGAGQTIIDGNGLGRAFAFYGQITVVGVTVTGGKAPFAGCECGGAFEVRQGGFLTLVNSVVQGNSAPGGGGGVDVDSKSKAILQNVLVSQNTSPSNGGGVHVGPVEGNTGTLEMTNVTISGNSTTAGAKGGGLDNEGSTTATNVTFAGNSSASDGGAILNASAGTLSLTNSTIATNIASGLGVGIRNLASSANVTLRNTIVSDGCSGAVASQGHNLDAGASCGFVALGDLQATDPRLGPLANNGGSIGLPTMALLAGSRAIDAGDNAACPTTDARGVSRPQGAVCDIGAYENAPAALSLGAVTSITAHTATLAGSVNPNLRDAIYHFEYGTTAAYGTSTPASDAGAGNTPIGITAGLTGLAPGTTYHYRLVATNPDGTSSTRDATFTTTPLGALPSPPVLTSVSQSSKRWIESNAKPRISRRAKLPIGTTFAFTLNETARVSFLFTQRVSGRRVAGRCVRPTRRNGHRPRCGLSVTRGTLTFTGHAGRNKVRFQGIISSASKLKPGVYTLVITAVDAAGQRSAAKTLIFTIVRR
jgi:CSLREA domain-containing protein